MDITDGFLGDADMESARARPAMSTHFGGFLYDRAEQDQLRE